MEWLRINLTCSVDMPLPAAAIPALISAGSSLAQGVGNWFAQKAQRRDERKEYNRQLAYNSPAEQMKRFGAAGLSPYLIYGQGNAGNASAPAPPASVIPEKYDFGKNLGEYMSVANFDADMKSKRLQNAILANEVDRSHWRNLNEGLMSTKRSLEILSDYPSYATRASDGKYYERDVSDSYRRKLNELKLSASQAGIEKIRAAIQGMSSENIVKSVKARYASEYGMVGGDWTQGLGLVRSAGSGLMSMFKSRARTNTQWRQMYRSWSSGNKFNVKP